MHLLATLEASGGQKMPDEGKSKKLNMSKKTLILYRMADSQLKVNFNDTSDILVVVIQRFWLKHRIFESHSLPICGDTISDY
jgi:hypothetical protein